MSNTIKLTQEELNKLQSIQSDYQNKVFQFGQFYLERLNLDEKIKQLAESENKVKDEFIAIQQEEQKWMNDISIKYGEGHLSLKDGTFIPTEKK